MTYYYLDPDMASFHRLCKALNQAVAICGMEKGSKPFMQATPALTA